MRWNHFGGSLLFAALASLGFPAARLILDPFFGSLFSTQLYLVAAAALYTLSIAPSLRRGFAGGGFVALLGMSLLFGGSRITELAIGLAAGVAVARSVLLYRARVARGVAIELALSLGGLLLARWFAGVGLLGGSFALWGYFLAQSMYFPISAAVPRRRNDPGDAFDEARARINTLLRESS